MREIKFRAWDGVKMIPSDSVKYFVEFDGTVWLNNGGREFDILNEQPNFKLMQFTGLKDKNGVEIYEGDVVKVEDVLGNPLDGWKDGVYKVEYALPDCAFCLVQLDNTSAISFNEVLEYEVIGNIYTNPELLKP